MKERNEKGKTFFFFWGMVCCLLFAACFSERTASAAQQEGEIAAAADSSEGGELSVTAAYSEDGELSVTAAYSEDGELSVTADYSEGGELSLTAAFSFQDEENGKITLRAGRDFALRLTVTAQGTDFSGHINVLMLNAKENHVLYQEEICVPAAGESAECVMFLPMNLMTEGLYLTLTDETGEVVLERTIPVETVNFGLYKQIAVFDPEELDKAETGNPYAHFSSYGSRLVEVSEEELAYGARALDALEIIVTQESALLSLETQITQEEGTSLASGTGTQTQAEAALDGLKEWVSGGKTLVVGASAQPDAEEVMLNLGLQEQDILQEVILRIGNYEAARNSILATNEELKKQYGENAHTAYIGDSMIWPVLVNSLSDEAVGLPVTQEETAREWWWTKEGEPEIIWEEKGMDILRAYRVGRGKVLCFSIPITCEESSVYPLFYYRLVQLALDNMEESQQYRLDSEMYGYSGGSEEYLLLWMEPEQGGVPVLPYIIILAVYIAVLLPSVFLLLRRFGKTKYLWGVLPALSFAVMGVVYIAGGRTRITEPYCSYVDITDYTEESGREEVYFSLSAPTNKGTEIMLKEGTGVRLEETYFRAYDPGWTDDYVSDENILLARSCRAAVSSTPDGTKLSLDTIAAFSKTTFYAWADAEEYTAFAAELAASDGRLSGTVTNCSKEPYREVYLLGEHYAARLGSIQPGESVELSGCRQSFREYGADWYSSGIYELVLDGAAYDMGKYNENYNQRIALYYLMQDYMTEPGYVPAAAEAAGEQTEPEAEEAEEDVYIFAVAEKDGSDILGDAAENPSSAGMRVFIWKVPMETEGREQK